LEDRGDRNSDRAAPTREFLAPQAISRRSVPKMTFTSPLCGEQHRTDRAGWRRNTRPPPDRRRSIPSLWSGRAHPAPRDARHCHGTTDANASTEQAASCAIAVQAFQVGKRWCHGFTIAVVAGSPLHRSESVQSVVLPTIASKRRRPQGSLAQNCGNFCYLSDAASMANCPRKTPAEI
jgi:hypothetical protein